MPDGKVIRNRYIMNIDGKLLIGDRAVEGMDGEIFAVSALTGQPLPPAFGGATKADLDQALSLAWDAYFTFRETSPQVRANFLKVIADEIAAIGDTLITRAMEESGLPRGRLEGERGRTMNQLRMFASELENHDVSDMRLDPGNPERKPVAKVELRSRRVGVGPVAVFGASNFPLAFSVAGGDTASALATGCPVIVKAHPAHLGTSALVGQAVQNAVRKCGLPDGVFSLLYATDLTIGESLVADERVRAVGFTGSRAGGLALMRIAQHRKRPIPVFAEMSSVNPVILFESALKARPEKIAREFVQSLVLGAGQFCTNPGIMLAVESEALDVFINTACDTIKTIAAQTMLTSGIAAACAKGVEALAQHPAVQAVGHGMAGSDRQTAAALFETDGAHFMAHKELQDEIFGAVGIIVRCRSLDEIQSIIKSMEGQLTVSMHIVPDDYAAAKAMLPFIEDLCGRVLVNGFGTGVELSRAMVHGGPFPSTSDDRTTSVGTMAIERFLRPICYQDFPAELLPDAFVARQP